MDRMKNLERQWSAVDEFLGGLLLQEDPALDRALEACAAAGLPPIQVSPCQGKLLHLLARLRGARLILEIGTLGGYSTIWLARALPPGGRVITLEIDPHHAQVASTNIARAGLSRSVELQVGPALEILPKLAGRISDLFDLVFIDADKASTPDYFRWALKLTRPGSVIIVDNVVRKGSVLESRSADPAVQGMRRFLELLAAEPRVTSTVIQTVGTKGYDGFAVALVNPAA